jgi:hypothetical protein
VRKTAESNKGNKVYDCPVEAALDVLGGKWALPIVGRLAPGTQRYSELKRSLPSISERMLDSGSIVVYIYNVNDEYNADYLVSDDSGRTWSDVKTAHFRKKIRNPQMASVSGWYFMHGRSGHYGEKEEKGHLVLYSSRDGLAWDDGIYLKMREAGTGAYSNSIVVGSLNPHKRKRLLIQASHAYEKSRTNVFDWWIDTTRTEQDFGSQKRSTGQNVHKGWAKLEISG